MVPLYQPSPCSYNMIKAIRRRIIRPSRKGETVVGLPLILTDQTLDFYSWEETYEKTGCSTAPSTAL